ncbi:hypothetical protein C6499_07860 [Candidatus Poribacteria bacterium]|nr:MAG: hypothetical protein C6499_07860 [Candidatus Poribacteria bacterium]
MSPLKSQFKTYIHLIKIQLIAKLTYRTHFFMVSVEYLLIIAVSYFLWKAILAHHRSIEGFTLKDMVTYVAVAGVFRFILNELSGCFWGEMQHQFQSGDLIMNLIKPIRYQVLLSCRALGGVLFQIVFRVIPTLVFWAFIVELTPPYHSALFLLSWILGAGIFAGMAFLVGLVTFFMESSTGVNIAVRTLTEIFSGTLIPLVMFPSWLVPIIKYLPFRFIFFQPIQIYFGHLDLQPALIAIGIQLLWLIGLFSAGNLLFQVITKRLTIQGG